MSSFFMYGATVATIVSTRTLPYTLLGLTGAVALIEAVVPYSYSYIAMYAVFAAVGAYHLSNIHVKNTLSVLPTEEDAVDDTDEAEATATAEAATADEEDIYADMPPLIPIVAEDLLETPSPPSVEDIVAPLPLSPLSSDSEDEDMYANIPALDEVTFEDTSIPELYVPLYDIHTIDTE